MKTESDFKTSVKRNYYQIQLKDIMTDFKITGTLKYVRIDADNKLQIITEEPLDQNTVQQEGKRQ